MGPVDIIERSRAFCGAAGELVGKITIVDELADEELHAACRLIDSRLPDPTQGLAIRPHPDGHAAQRVQLLELAQHLEALRPLSEKDLRWVPVPNLDDVIDDLNAIGRLRRLWLSRAFPRR